MPQFVKKCLSFSLIRVFIVCRGVIVYYQVRKGWKDHENKQRWELKESGKIPRTRSNCQRASSRHFDFRLYFVTRNNPRESETRPSSRKLQAHSLCSHPSILQSPFLFIFPAGDHRRQSWQLGLDEIFQTTVNGNELFFCNSKSCIFIK